MIIFCNNDNINRVILTHNQNVVKENIHIYIFTLYISLRVDNLYLVIAQYKVITALPS